MPGWKNARQTSQNTVAAPKSTMSARVLPYCLPLVRPWVAASVTLTERRGWLIALDEDGLTGWGDCAPLPSAHSENPCRTALAHLAVTGTLPPESPPETLWALDTARQDLDAQRQGIPLARALTPNAAAEIAVNAALGTLDAGCVERAHAARMQGFRIAKIKVGLAPIAEELARLGEIAAVFGGRLRLDANRAWPEVVARRFLTAIANLPIDAVEEPLAHPSLHTLAALQAALPYALAVDESLSSLSLRMLIDTRAVRRLVLKPARLGRFAATQAIARQAQAAGIEIVLTSVIDSAIGVTAAAHLAAALAPNETHGLGTCAWLAADVATAPPIVDGTMILPQCPGLCIQPHKDPA